MPADFSEIELRQRVRWYAGVRWFYLLLLAGAGLVPLYLKSGWNDNFRHQTIIGLTGVVLNIIVLIATRRHGGKKIFYLLLAVAQVVFDILLVTWILYQNGALESRSIILYTIPIFMTGALLGRLAIYLAAGGSAAAYICLVSLDHFGLIHPPNAIFAYAHTDLFYYVSSVFFYGAVFLALAIISDYVSRLIRESEQLNEEVHALSAKNAETEAIIKTMGSALVAMDTNGRIKLVNDSFARLTGWHRNEVVGRKLDDVLPVLDESGHPAGPEAHPMRELESAFRAEEAAVRQIKGYSYVRKDGSSFPVFAYWAPITLLGGRIIGWTTVFDDATDVQKLEQLKSNFIALVSHQLKTPIAEIRDYINNMTFGVVGELTAKQREYLNDIDEVAQRSSKLIADLLDITVLEQGKAMLSLGPVDFSEVIEKSIAVHKNRLHQRKLTVKVVGADTPVTVLADMAKTVEIVNNILANAISYSREGKTITISTKVAGDNGEVRVIDEGRGMDPKTLDVLFNKSQVLSGAPTAEGGTGLGLYLAKQLINLQNGSITVEKTSDAGTTICISLPLVKR
ncbi:MAG TPA: PAS domain-containing sensor histidine kinase [Candidatus Saccharimonadales bacterium]|nr:PAS domain-containing sensor histidine kinase [Candidatus Saccharimonadales bacterium]